MCALALFQIHAPLHPASFEEQGHGLADVVEKAGGPNSGGGFRFVNYEGKDLPL